MVCVRIPTVIPGVKNPTAAPQVTAETQVHPQTKTVGQGSGVASVVMQLAAMAQIHSWPGNFHIPWVRTLQKRKEKGKGVYKPQI